MASHRDRQQVVLAPNGFFISHGRRPWRFFAVCVCHYWSRAGLLREKLLEETE
jgi:hypothetical protein